MWFMTVAMCDRVRGSNVLTVCWSAKGGSGTTVVACALALLSARRNETSLLVDLAGDVPAVLGVGDPPGPGVHNWVASSTAAPSAIAAIGTSVDVHLRLIAAGSTTAPIDHRRWFELGEHLAELDAEVVVDAGTAPPPGLLEPATQNLLVTRPCYVAVRRAVAHAVRPSAVVLICEPGHPLSADDVGAAVHAPVVAEIGFDPSVARAVDTGLMMSRLPRVLTHDLRELIP